MTTTAGCPACGHALEGLPHCTACGLRLVGSDAQRLWYVDEQLTRLRAQVSGLEADRQRLLEGLRSAEAPAPPAPVTVPVPAGATPAGFGVPAPAPAPEWTPERVQGTLLTLGGLLVVVAAAVFTVVAYDRLGLVGRAAVLLAVTGLAAAAPVVALRRGLSATAETFASIAVLLALLDGAALRSAGLTSLGAQGFWAWTVLAVGGLALAYAVAVPALRAPRVAGPVLVQLSLVVASDLLGSDRTGGLVLPGLVAPAAVLALWAMGRRERLVRQTTAIGAALVSACVAALAAAAAFDLEVGDGSRRAVQTAAVVLLVQALSAAGAAAALRLDDDLRDVLVLGAVGALGLAVGGLAHDRVRVPDDFALPVAALALVSAAAALAVPTAWRRGLAGGAVPLAGWSLAVVAPAVGEALVLPVTWAGHRRSTALVGSARDQLGWQQHWQGSAVTLVVVLVSATAIALAVHELSGVRPAAVVGAAGALAALPLLALGLDLPFAAALVLDTALAAALVLGSTWVPRPAVAGPLWVAGIVLVQVPLAWSLAHGGITVWLQAGFAVGLAVAALRRGPVPGADALLAVLAVAACVHEAGVWEGVPRTRAALLSLLVPAAIVAARSARVLPRRHEADGVGLELGAAVSAAIAVLLCLDDAHDLALALSLTGLLALATAMAPDRRGAAWVGTALLTVASWVRLGDAGVEAPEAYVLPVSLVALGIGVARRRTDPSVSSTSAYAAGLSGALVPSLLASFGEDEPTRAVLVGLASVVVVLLGVQRRLKAPLLVGGTVLALDALAQLGPVAAELPRWVSLGTAGLLLLGVGSTYEARRRDLERLRAAIDAMG